jgi:flagellar basal-body rod protein FlgB
MRMNLPDVPLLSMLRERMTWLEARQNVLSQNVANADTPDFAARDLVPQDFQSILRRATGNPFQVPLAATEGRHIAIAPASAEYGSRETPDVEQGLNGNSVSLEQEMIKVSDTQAQFQAATNLYSKALSMMRTALGKSGP